MHAWLIAALVVAWCLAGAVTAALILSIQQYGKALARIDELHERMHELVASGGEMPAVPAMERGLPIGAEAPPFELLDLEGDPHRLAEYLGEPFVLVFFSPTCGYCLDLSQHLGRLNGSRRYVLVTQGDIEQNRRLAREHEWKCDVLHESDWAVIKAYDTPATPSGYLIDESGRIASPLVTGVDALLALNDFVPMTPEANGSENGKGQAVAAALGSVRMSSGGNAMKLAPAPAKLRGVEDSSIVRDGLKAGTIAPTFVLPDLEGEMHSLADFHGRRVLLVFSDSDCAPCERLAPDLVALHTGASSDLEIVMISRGDVERNRAKAATHGYPFPVLLQRSWEVSKLYGMFATPIAYLIDENGVITNDVAVGPDAILALAS